MSLPRLLVLTDRSQLRPGRGLLRTVTELVSAGATHVVLRELDLPAERRAELAASLADTGARLIAARTPLPGCAGVHLPAAAPPAGGAGLVGRSCHSASDVRRAAAEPVSYCTLSPFAATASKPGYGPPVPPGGFTGHGVPVYALGGITPANAPAALDAGAHGVAVMGEVMRAEDPARTVADLLQALA